MQYIPLWTVVLKIPYPYDRLANRNRNAARQVVGCLRKHGWRVVYSVRQNWRAPRPRKTVSEHQGQWALFGSCTSLLVHLALFADTTLFVPYINYYCFVSLSTYRIVSYLIEKETGYLFCFLLLFWTSKRFWEKFSFRSRCRVKYADVGILQYSSSTYLQVSYLMTKE